MYLQLLKVFSLLVQMLALSVGDDITAKGPASVSDGYSYLGDGACDECQWTSTSGAFYDLSRLCGAPHTVKMDMPRGSHLVFGVCDVVPCETDNPDGIMACVFVPGNPATSTGSRMQFAQIQENIPSKGVRLSLLEGKMCSVNNKPRKTVIDFECQTFGGSQPQTDDTQPVRGESVREWEGEGTDVCTYYVRFSTSQGCPTHTNKYSPLSPRITAVTGCVNTVPNLSVTECPPAGGTVITIHGLDFTITNSKPNQIVVTIGKDVECTNAHIVDPWTMTCTLGAGSGENLPITILFVTMAAGSGPDVDLKETHVSSTQATISYKPLVDYRQHFDSFVDLGVGGLTSQIKQLYQRAFASRSIPATVLKQLGIEHAKGILLHGPPGSGKTLLARTIAKILQTDQVKMINAPEIMSKYLGESEKNLRSYFEEAEKAWIELGEASDLFVIIIDEIDAICKPRGKSDSSAAAAAYDSVVNQLLTKMDGLRALYNVLVIGMTNRPDMIDPALLRPGRFEIQIEIGLPDERGRWEIFYIHTRQMSDNGYLATDVNLEELAHNTTQFSGAEIAGIVRLAASFALDRKYGHSSNEEPLLLLAKDFKNALEQTKPAYTQREDQVVEEFLPRGYLPCGQGHDTVVSEIGRRIDSLLHSPNTRLGSVLLYGARGVGKSGIAAHIASLHTFTYVKVISPKRLLRYNEDAQVELLIDTFQEAFKASFSLVILDDIHNLVQLVNIANQIKASHILLHTLATLLSSSPPADSKVFVIGTILCCEVLLENYFTGKVGLQHHFSASLRVPKLNAAATYAVMDDLNLKREGGVYFKLADHFSISVGDLLKVTDCVEHEAAALTRGKSDIPQSVLDICLELHPHVEPVSFNI